MLKKLDKAKLQHQIDLLNKYSLLFHILLSSFVIFVIEWVSRHSFIEAASFFLKTPWVFFYNAFIIYISFLLVYLFQKRTLARLLISVLWLFLGIVNGCVLLKRVSPFSFTDIKLIGDLFTMNSNYFTNTEAAIVIVGVVLLISFLFFLWKKGPTYKGRPRRILASVSIAGFCLCIPIITTAAIDANILSGYFENLSKGYKDYGFVYSFSASVVDRGMAIPENYNKKTVEELNTSINKENTQTNSPNVVVVLLESFMDPNTVNFLKTSNDAIPNFRALSNNFTSGYLEVPVIGAGTANTEFEILTGMSMRYFGVGEYPYKTALKSNSCESIASTLDKIGYGTHVVHNNGGNFYSRANAFTQMGFDTFTAKENLNIQEYTPLGTWPTDDILINSVTDALDSTPEQQDLIYTITVEAHGSYPSEKVIENPTITVTGAETEGLNNQWEYYINQLYAVDQFIADLVKELESRDEETILVLFSDHLPTMGLEETDLSTGSLFKTQYATWNNFGLEKTESTDLAAYQLLAFITDQINIHEGTIFTLHQDEVQVSSPDYFKNFELLQYDVLYGDKFSYGGVDRYPASDMVMGTQEVTITNAFLNETQLIVEGNNFTPWTKVFVNGEKVSTKFIDGSHLSIASEGIVVADTLIANVMGSSSSIFRSSNDYILSNLQATQTINYLYSESDVANVQDEIRHIKNDIAQ